MYHTQHILSALFCFSVAAGATAVTLDCAPSSVTAGCTTTGSSTAGQVYVMFGYLPHVELSIAATYH